MGRHWPRTTESACLKKQFSQHRGWSRHSWSQLFVSNFLPWLAWFVPRQDSFVPRESSRWTSVRKGGIGHCGLLPPDTLDTDGSNLGQSLPSLSTWLCRPRSNLPREVRNQPYFRRLFSPQAWRAERMRERVGCRTRRRLWTRGAAPPQTSVTLTTNNPRRVPPSPPPCIHLFCPSPDHWSTAVWLFMHVAGNGHPRSRKTHLQGGAVHQSCGFAGHGQNIGWNSSNCP